MTKDKDFKDLVRTRAGETGEKYTEARGRLIADGPEQDRRRIVGLENRYAVTAEVVGGGRLPPEDVARHLFRGASRRGGSNVYLPNGARLYVAAPGVIEYATPECSSAREALCHVRAGESLLVQLAHLAEARFVAEDEQAVFSVAVDRSPASGSHESYGAPRSFPAQRIHEFLVPFLVTRQVFSGSGGLVDTPEGPQFVLSPRAYQVAEVESYGGVVNADANPHADPARYRRIHIDVGDTNRSDAAALLKVATTRLVLRVIEEASDALGEFLCLEAPMTALREVSLDPTCTSTIRPLSGPPKTAVDVQSLVLRAVRRHVAKTSATSEERRTIDRWQKVIDGLRSDPLSLDDSVEWVARMRRLGEVGTGRIVADELDRIGSSEASFAAHRLCSKEEVEFAARMAPASTRASTRAQFIDACVKGRRDYTVDWSHLKLNDEANRTVIVRNPYGIEDDRIEKFLAYIRSGPTEDL